MTDDTKKLRRHGRTKSDYVVNLKPKSYYSTNSLLLRALKERESDHTAVFRLLGGSPLDADLEFPFEEV